MALYFSNSTCQSISLRGGKAPSTGFHSVMESPDPVMRVAPPTTTMAHTKPAKTHSQILISCKERGCSAGDEGAAKSGEAEGVDMEKS